MASRQPMANLSITFFKRLRLAQLPIRVLTMALEDWADSRESSARRSWVFRAAVPYHCIALKSLPTCWRNRMQGSQIAASLCHRIQ
jgi:hypothetical protein